MSWDLAFWKPSGPSSEQPFRDISDDCSELNWEGAGSYFEVAWPVGSKPAHTLGVFVSCGWKLLHQPAVIERVRAMTLGLRCGVFDPQSGEWSHPAGQA